MESDIPQEVLEMIAKYQVAYKDIASWFLDNSKQIFAKAKKGIDYIVAVGDLDNQNLMPQLHGFKTQEETKKFEKDCEHQGKVVYSQHRDYGKGIWIF